MIIFRRGLVFASVSHRKCEACGEHRNGLNIEGAADAPLCVCALCFTELFVSAMPQLSREIIRGLQNAAP